MKRFVIRHGFTGVQRDDRYAFGIEGPSLNATGLKQAASLKNKLIEFGINPANESVAVSELLRTRHTAEIAGFKDINIYAVLNEVKTGLPANQIKDMLVARNTPEEAIRRAKLVLDNPPKEEVWIIHGLLIVGLHAALNIKRDPFIPDFCEISIIDI